MSDLFKNIAGLGLATYIGKARRKSDFDRMNQLRLKNGLPELPWEDAPIDKAMNWVGDKFKTWTGPDAAKAPEAKAPTTPGGSEDVGLWERLKAGNIDQEGSEAYNRWGKGKAEGERRVADLDESSRLEAKKEFDNLQASEPGLVTLEQQANAPAEIEASIDAIKKNDESPNFSKEQFDNAPDMANEPMKMNRFEGINTPF